MTIPQEYLNKIGTLVPIEDCKADINLWTICLKNAIDYFRYIGNCPLRFHKYLPRIWEPSVDNRNATRMTTWLVFFDAFLGYEQRSMAELFEELEEKVDITNEDLETFWNLVGEKQIKYHERPARLRFFL